MIVLLVFSVIELLFGSLNEVICLIWVWKFVCSVIVNCGMKISFVVLFRVVVFVVRKCCCFMLGLLWLVVFKV